MAQQKKALKTVNIKGKQYVEVKERIRYFRENYPGFKLRTEWIHIDENLAIAKGLVIDHEGIVVAEGTSMEVKTAKGINLTSHIENCESSAWGRALGNFGIGIDAAVASADEVEKAQALQAKLAPEKTHAEKVDVALIILQKEFKVSQEDVVNKLQVLDKDEITEDKLAELRNIVLDLKSGSPVSKHFAKANQSKVNDAVAHIQNHVKANKKA